MNLLQSSDNVAGFSFSMLLTFYNVINTPVFNIATVTLLQQYVCRLLT